MAFVNALRVGTARLSGRRITFAPLLANTRSFSSILQHSCLNNNVQARSSVFRLLAASRAFSSSRVVKSAPVTTPTAVVDDAKAVDATPVTPPPVPVESIPTDTLSDAAHNTLNSIYPALQYGDLAALGIAGWTPAGLIRWSLELIHVTTHLPWFWTIVAGTLFWKLVTLYVNIVGLQNSARLLPIQGEVNVIQAKMQAARQAGDMLQMQKQGLKMKSLYKKADVSVGKTLLVPFVQLPITLGIFFGVKKMCELPVAQLKDSGFSLLPDLTVPDATLIFPILFTAIVNMQIYVGRNEMNIADRPAMGHLMNFIQVLSLAGGYIATGWPSGLVLALTSTALFTTIQSRLLQVPSIRNKLNIPPILPVEKRGKLPTMIESVRYGVDSVNSFVEDAKKQQTRK